MPFPSSSTLVVLTLTLLKCQALISELFTEIADCSFYSPFTGTQGSELRSGKNFHHVKAVLFPLHNTGTSTMKVFSVWPRSQDSCSNTTPALVINSSECKLIPDLSSMTTKWQDWSGIYFPELVKETKDIQNVFSSNIT